MYSCAYPKPGETQHDFAVDHLFQKDKLCTTLGGRGIWTRDETYATKPPYEKMDGIGEYEEQEKPKKEIALKLIDAMLEKVESLDDTDEKRAKYNEYLHLRDKIIVYPITSLRFMFYYIKEEYRQFRNVVHISEEYIVNPVIEYAFEMVNHSLRPAAEGKKDFEEPKKSQSGLILYRGPTIPVPKFTRPKSDDPDMESIRNAGIKKEEEIQEFNERRRKRDERIIYERKYERNVIPPSTIIPGWRDVLTTWWQQKGRKGGKTKRARNQKRLSKTKKSIKRNSQRHRKMSRKH
jgi:hypothetical protein